MPVRQYTYQGCSATEATPTGFYELAIDDRSQYSQRNATGEGPFVVFHNKDYKQYQVCWLLLSLGRHVFDTLVLAPLR